MLHIIPGIEGLAKKDTRFKFSQDVGLALMFKWIAHGQKCSGGGEGRGDVLLTSKPHVHILPGKQEGGRVLV